jgi:hypothetical protein
MEAISICQSAETEHSPQKYVSPRLTTASAGQLAHFMQVVIGKSADYLK